MDLNNAGGGQTVFCNPPYGRAIKDWVKKSSEEVKKPNTTVVMLIPARTECGNSLYSWQIKIWRR